MTLEERIREWLDSDDSTGCAVVEPDAFRFLRDAVAELARLRLIETAAREIPPWPAAGTRGPRLRLSALLGEAGR